MHKRIVILYTVILLLTTVVMIELAKLSQGGALQQAATTQSNYSLKVGESRGMIYDRNLKPLVNRSSRTVLAVAPNADTVAVLQSTLPRDELLELLPLLESGRPVAVSTSKSVSAEGIDAFRLPVRYGKNNFAPHVLGYLDGSGAGVAGVEAGYDSYLKEKGGSIKIRYDINAMGGPLGGAAAEISDTRAQSEGGVVLTLDRDIQRIAEQCAALMQTGAVVIMDVHSGEIVGMASVPDYDPERVGASLSAKNSPLFNRATAAYSVGSTFKLTVAAAALESGFTTEHSYICPGYYQLGEQRYYCHNRAGHWELAMQRAVGQSCNPYFIDLGQRLGAKKLLAMATAMGFGSATQLAQGVTSSAGTLPLYADEVGAGELANLSFGQGTLTATPVQVTRMTAIIANGGYSVQPTLYRGLTNDGYSVISEAEAPVARIISPATADTLRELMCFVVESGSGKGAQPAYTDAGGKTGSAQTGVYEDGIEIVHGWFTGFFPAEEPRYAITVLEEGGGNGGAAPAGIFGKICDGITLLSDFNLQRSAK